MNKQDYVEAFKAAVREKRFVARNFTFDPAAADVRIYFMCIIWVYVHVCAMICDMYAPWLTTLHPSIHRHINAKTEREEGAGAGGD